MCTRSGPRVPLLLLSAAASRLPASVLCVGVPVFVFCSAPPLCCPLSLILPPLIQGAFTVIWPLPVFLSLFSCLVSASWCFGPLPRVEFVFDFLGATQLLWSSAVLPPPPFVCPLFGFGALSVVFWFVGCLLWGLLSCVLWVGLSGEVGPASSHGLDRTAANFTGADQWSSLPCCPERPRAAKSAHMVRSVGSSGIAEMAFCDVLCICARCCNLLLTAWTVQHYCKQCWDEETLTALNSHAWPQVRNRVIFEGATLQVLC